MYQANLVRSKGPPQIPRQRGAAPWAVADVYRAQGIVGIEIEIAGIEGEWKVSQNAPEPQMGLAAD